LQVFGKSRRFDPLDANGNNPGKIQPEQPVRNRSAFITLRWISVLLIFLAAVLTALQLVYYSRIRSTFPPGMVIAGVPVGRLDQQRAAERLLQAYTAVPVEVRYRDAVIQIRPAVVGFEMDIQAMMSAADQERMQQPFWSGFWDFLWNRLPVPKEVPLRATYSEDRLRAYLAGEIATRYDQSPVAAMPLPGSTGFQPSKPGTVLDIDRAVILVDAALRSPNARVVNLSFNRINPPRPSMLNLQLLLQQVIELAGFDGLIEVYVNDLQTTQEVHFAYLDGQLVPPDIAFTAASTMKIPIMVSTMRRVDESSSEDVQRLIQQMIERSENDPADRLMEIVMDKNLGPLEVTQDMQSLGFSNTFLAGYFYPGAPLLQRIKTPANQRTDISIRPDAYNQTTAVEMGLLIEDIYRCAETGGGTFAAVFPGEITQSECRAMINYLVQNKIAVLLQAGLPEGTRIAHKHGWIIETDGLMHTIANTGVVYSPGGNYVISVFAYHPVQIVFPPINRMIAELSQAVYNYFNIP
jgi:beta-lactamase class A